MRGLLPAPRAVGTVTAGATQAWGPGQVGGRPFTTSLDSWWQRDVGSAQSVFIRRKNSPHPSSSPWNQSTSTKEQLDVTLTLGFSEVALEGGPAGGRAAGLL